MKRKTERQILARSAVYGPQLPSEAQHLPLPQWGDALLLQRDQASRHRIRGAVSAAFWKRGQPPESRAFSPPPTFLRFNRAMRDYAKAELRCLPKGFREGFGPSSGALPGPPHRSEPAFFRVRGRRDISL